MCLLWLTAYSCGYCSSTQGYCVASSLQVNDQMKLGEWVGLCKIDKTGTARKVVKCSCTVIKVCSVSCVVVGCNTLSISLCMQRDRLDEGTA